jgi:hypothetical protein
MKTLIFIAFFSLTAFAQEKKIIPGLGSTKALIDETTREVDLVLDVTDKVVAAKSKKGKQLIATDKKVNLYVHVQNGKVVSYAASNFGGKQLKIDEIKAFQSCQLCVVDQEGGTVCWGVDCNELP